MKNLTLGTPKTLDQAIKNGCTESLDKISPSDTLVESLRDHIQDFLSQHFTAAMLRDWTLTELWARIIEREKL